MAGRKLSGKNSKKHGTKPGKKHSEKIPAAGAKAGEAASNLQEEDVSDDFEIDLAQGPDWSARRRTASVPAEGEDLSDADFVRQYGNVVEAVQALAKGGPLYAENPTPVSELPILEQEEETLLAKIAAHRSQVAAYGHQVKENKWPKNLEFAQDLVKILTAELRMLHLIRTKVVHERNDRIGIPLAELFVNLRKRTNISTSASARPSRRSSENLPQLALQSCRITNRITWFESTTSTMTLTKPSALRCSLIAGISATRPL